MFKYKVEVKVATNPEIGLGLFASEPIKKDSIVWEFLDGIDIRISKERLEKLDEAQKDYFFKYGWFQDDDHMYSSCDLTNFINHSFQPNLKVVDEIVIAIRDIEIGDELFENYQEFDPDFDEYKDSLV
jgi:SET domain-containing protein